ncbi:PREDICTED: uncharacterized protein LOC109185208 [Ipomoea nil]|uniref:uncharacterized protein LOC109185208 n=1 Tax=Ipomoea nil TaxID=35883 RepID=UPI000901200B|nr:PREDICTED: uncharacterized protein LOC109185208 [Ipomoea nil]
MGFHQSKADPSLFINGNGMNFLAILVYVDDIFVSSPSISLIRELKTYLDDTFKIKDLSNHGYFLGIEAHMTSTCLNLCQHKFALDILIEAGFLDSKPVSTPMVSGHRLDKDGGEAVTDVASYRRLIVHLLYLTATRPEISFAVQQLSQFVDSPTNGHMSSTHRVLRYIKATPGQGIFYPQNGDMQLNVFSDSDWATCSTTRKSITSFCVFLDSALISWRSKKQATVSRSSSEAEYRALAAVVCEVQWLNYLLKDLQVELSRPTAVFCDNKSVVAIAENSVFHETTKHIEIDCHIIREKLTQGLVKLLSISSSNQVADGFTKALPTAQFHLFLSKLGIQDLHAPAYRGYWSMQHVEKLTKLRGSGVK